MAQYKEPEKKDKIDIYRSEVAFDSLQARKTLPGVNATIKGKAFTKQKNKMVIKEDGEIVKVRLH